MVSEVATPEERLEPNAGRMTPRRARSVIPWGGWRMQASGVEDANQSRFVCIADALDRNCVAQGALA